MFIAVACVNFAPTNFEILDFYGKDTCFVWTENQLVVFPDSESVATVNLPIIESPQNIKSIKSYNGRVFVICEPRGLYKLDRDYKFLLYSRTAIGFGRTYTEIYSSENQSLYLKHKTNQVVRELFRLEQTSKNHNNICDITLQISTSDLNLRKAFLHPEDSSNEDVLIVSNDRRVFKVTSEDVCLIYTCDQEIVNIVPILQDVKTMGFVLVAHTAAVLVYVTNGKLKFDKLYFDKEVQSLCAGMNAESKDIIWIAHISGTEIYYSAKTISADTFHRTGMQYMRFVAIKNYNSKVLRSLSNNRQLLKVDVQHLGLGKVDGEEFFDLKPEMLKGTERIVDRICEKTKELQWWNEEVLKEQEKSKRISIYAHRAAIVYLPKVQVQRIAGQVFLRVTFKDVLPLNCYVVVLLKCSGETRYCMKLVKDSDTFVDVPVEKNVMNFSLKLSIDLVTMADKGEPWCLIRNYVKEPIPLHRIGKHIDKKNFFKAKLTALRNLASEDNRHMLNMIKLSSIKKSIRKESSNS